METQFADMLRPLLGLMLGASIGLGFGLLQSAAQRRHDRRQNDGRLKTGWTLVPGSMGRVAFLLIALVIVQGISPALFAGGARWLVSVGVVAGYGALIGWRLYRRRFDGRALPAGSP